MSYVEQTIEELKQKAKDSWSSKTGIERSKRIEKFIRELLPHYSEKLGYSEEEVLRAIEGRRDYSCINYYNEANFPRLDDVRIFDSVNDVIEAFPSRQFRCPACDGVSSNPYKCSLEECDWKVYGLFRDLGKGLKFTIRSTFLEHGTIDIIFMPLELEEVETA